MFNKEADYSIEKISPDKEARQKLWLIVFLFCYMLLFGITVSMEEPKSGLASFIDIIFLPILIATSLTWVQIDMRAKGKLINIDWSLGLFLFAPVVFPLYLYKTRGIKSGSILLIKTIVVLVTCLILSTTSAVIYESVIKT